MPWRGSEGKWPLGYTWRGGVDAAGMPHGHGVLMCPANSTVEFQEGAMAAGRKHGPWVFKCRDGTWESWKCVDDVDRDVKVLPARTDICASTPHADPSKGKARGLGRHSLAPFRNPRLAAVSRRKCFLQALFHVPILPLF